MCSKKFYIALLLSACKLILMLSNPTTVLAQITGSVLVKVLDDENSDPLPGVVLEHMTHHAGRASTHRYVTDHEGCCRIPNNGDKQLVLSLKLIGFAEIKEKVYSVPKAGKKLVIRMAPESELLGEVQVSAQRRHTSRLQQVEVIATETLERGTSLTLAKMLEQVPGVSSISSGGTIAKPVIQGMHSSRILLVNNGVKLESQSWGEDHAPEIDHTGATIVEVVKGADAVKYGYGAMGGVVIFNQAPLPYGNSKPEVGGKAAVGYMSNGQGIDSGVNIEGGYKGFAARFHAMYQKAGDYSTAEYILNNTGYNNISFSGQVGYKWHKLTASLYGSLYTSRSGIYYASSISDMDQLLLRFEAGRPDETSLRPFSYTIEPPFQQTQHVTVKADIKYAINKDHTITLKASYQDNLRQEFENRKVKELSWLPVQDLMLTTFNGDLYWDAKWKLWDMTTQAGGSWLYQYNYNIPGTKQPAFIPNFTALTMGGYVIHKISLGDLLLSGGLRYDVRGQDISGYTSVTTFKYYDSFRIYKNFTGTLAAYYPINENYDVRANIGWAWRPPDINELYATGLSHGAYWVAGNSDLEAEHGYKAILGGSFHNEWINVEPSAFYQHFQNYIYDHLGKGNDRFHNHPSGKYPKFLYDQDEVFLYGGDLTVALRPMEHLKVTTSGEWILGRNATQASWLPFMPSDRYTLNVSYDTVLDNEKKWSASATLGGLYVTKQTRFDASKDLVPETPPAYFLLDGSAEVSYDLGQNRSVCLMITGDNILNALYKEYTDRFRYYAHAMGAQYTCKVLFSF